MNPARHRRPLVALAAALVAGPAQACGYCVEDKIAAVYDHALVSQALAQWLAQPG